MPWRWVSILGKSIARRSLGLAGSIQCRRVELKIPQYTLQADLGADQSPYAASLPRMRHRLPVILCPIDSSKIAQSVKSTPIADQGKDPMCPSDLQDTK